MSDNNHVEGQTKDVQPPDATRATPAAAQAKRRLAAYLRAPVDLYRAIHPDGTSTTRNITGTNISRRIDTINVSTPLMEGDKRFVKATHVPPSEYMIMHTHERKRQEIEKESDHSLVRATLRVSNIPKAKKQPAFASEILATAEGRERMAKTVLQTIQRAREEAADGAGRQMAIAQAMMEESLAYRKEQSGNAKRKAAAAHKKLVNFTAKLEMATKKTDKQKWHAQMERARAEYRRAVSHRQSIEETRRRHMDVANDEESVQQMNERLQNAAARQPCTRAIGKRTNAAGQDEEWIATTNEDIHKVFAEQWRPIMQLDMDDASSERASATILQHIRAAKKNSLSNDERAALEIEAILTKENIEAAIMRIKSHTSPGSDGVPIDPYQACMQHGEAKGEMLEHLRELFQEIMRRGEMTANMRESVTTMVHKKNETTDPANYRPIAVTATEYRILATAMAMRLAQVLHKLIGESQIGFMIERLIDENIDLMMETLRYANEEASERGGAIVILDNTAAYDHVWRPFLMRTLEAFGLPRSFRHAVATLMHNSTTRLKINGTTGLQIEQTSGVRQGCPLSSMLYLFVMEVMLTTIREDDRISGMQIPGTNGSDEAHERTTVKERSLADDLAVYITNLARSIPALREDLLAFREMSGQRIKLAKSATVLCGADAARGTAAVQALWPGMTFSTMSIEVAKYHGIEIGTNERAALQWEKKAAEVSAIMDEDARVFTPRSIIGRVRLARSRYVSKVAYMFKYQVPERQTADEILDKLQAKIKQNVMGSVGWMEKAVALQTREDGGFAMPSVQSELEAAWVNMTLQAMKVAARPWTNFIRYQLQRAYGKMGEGTRLLTANLSYQTLVDAPVGAITEKMRRAFEVYGALPRIQPMQAERTLTGTTTTETEQRARAAPRIKQVAYYVEKCTDNMANGIRPKAPKRTERAPPAEDIVRKCLTKYGSEWGIRLHSDPVRAMVEIDDDRGAEPPKLTGRILAVEMHPGDGRWVRLDNAGARQRAKLTPAQEKSAKTTLPILLIGQEGAVPTITAQHVLSHIEGGPMAHVATAEERTYAQRLKAVPESTRCELRQWAEQVMTTATQSVDEDRQCVRTHWGRAEVLRQVLWHNAYYAEDNDQGCRSTAATEREMMDWTAAGVVTVQDVLNSTGDDVMTNREFERAWPGLRAETYAEMLAVLPHEWRQTLRHGESEEAAARERWWRQRNRYWRMWTEEVDEGVVTRKLQEYEREQETRRLRPKRAATLAKQPPIGTAECRVLAIRASTRNVATWTTGTAKDMRKARDEEWTHEVDDAELKVSHEPLEDITIQTGGLVERQATPMHQLKAKHIRAIRAAPRPVIPRAWDITRPTEHFARLYGGRDHERVVAALRKAIKGSNHPVIPAHVQDVLYKVIVSGFETHTAGREVHCARSRAQGQQVEDTLEHRYAQHPGTQALWQEVVARWNAATYDTVNAEDVRVTLLGDRGDGTKAVDETLWRMVHAATIWTIHRDAKTAQEHPARYTAPTIATLMKHTQKMAQRMLEKAWQRRDVYGAEIREWRAAGWVYGGKTPRIAVLSMVEEEQDTRTCSGIGRRDADSGSGVAVTGATDGEERGRGQPRGEHVATARMYAAPGNEDHPCGRRPCSGARTEEGECERQNDENRAAETDARSLRHTEVGPDASSTNREQSTPQEGTNCRGDDLAVARENHNAATREERGGKRYIHQYSDGAWEEPDEDTPPTPAGYGVVEFEEVETPRAPMNATGSGDGSYEMGQRGVKEPSNPRRAKMTWAAAGIVETDPDGDEYIGATKHTNNTGELTAMHIMLRRALTRHAGHTEETLHSDSLYAINMTTGKWMPRKQANQALVSDLRRKWRQLQRKRPQEVSLKHVRSHIGMPGNEVADHLAGLRWTRTASGQTELAEARRWLTQWLTAAPRGTGDG